MPLKYWQYVMNRLGKERGSYKGGLDCICVTPTQTKQKQRTHKYKKSRHAKYKYRQILKIFLLNLSKGYYNFSQTFLMKWRRHFRSHKVYLFFTSISNQVDLAISMILVARVFVMCDFFHFFMNIFICIVFFSILFSVLFQHLHAGSSLC